MNHRLTILCHKEKWEDYKKACAKKKTDASKDLREHMESVTESQSCS
jgi:hypothetical protein